MSIEEDNKIQFDEKAIRTNIQKEKNSVISKLYIDRKISKEVVRTTMNKAWKPTIPFSMLEISSNVFIFSFDSKDDMQKVMNRHPWLFETSLLSLKPFNGYTPTIKIDFSKEVFWVHMHDLCIGCMNEKIGIDICKTIGTVK